MIVRWLIASVVARSNPLSPQALADAAAISFQRDPECRRPAPGLPSPGSYCTTLAGLLLLLSSALPAAPARPDAASVSQISPTAQAQILALIAETTGDASGAVGTALGELAASGNETLP